MAAIVHSDKAKKAIKKIKEAMQDYPLGIEFGELMQKTGYAKSSLYSALSLVGAQKSDDGLWHLPGSQNVATCQPQQAALLVLLIVSVATVKSELPGTKLSMKLIKTL